MLVAAAVCPHPPVLVPAVAGGAAEELSGLRAACVESVRRLVDSGAPLVVVGRAAEAGTWAGSAGGSLAPFGVDVSFGGADQALPLSLTVARYLLDAAGCSNDPLRFVAVTDWTGPEECAAIGADLTSGPDPVALLVMGDGSAKRSTTSPGYVDERAAGYDEAVVNALEKADVDALLALVPELARDLWVAGRPAWQVLAGAGRAAYDAGATIHGHVPYDDAPYGVGYAVVDWLVSQA